MEPPIYRTVMSESDLSTCIAFLGDATDGVVKKSRYLNVHCATLSVRDRRTSPFKAGATYSDIGWTLMHLVRGESGSRR